MKLLVIRWIEILIISRVLGRHILDEFDGLNWLRLGLYWLPLLPIPVVSPQLLYFGINSTMRELGWVSCKLVRLRLWVFGVHAMCFFYFI